MRRQRSLVCRAQLLAAGVSHDTIDTWLRRGVLEGVELGVYRSPESVSSDEQRLLAAVFRAGDGARATGWSACGLYGLEGFDLRDHPWVAIPRNRRVRGVDFVVQRADLERCDLATVAGVPAVTPTRALVDVAGRVTGKPLRVGIDDARRQRLVDLDRLLARAVQLGRHPGAIAVRRLFGSGLLDQDGELERQLALALHAAGLRPVWGMEVLPGIVVDTAFVEASYAIECDGARWHTIDADRAADITREGALVADGWRVDRVGHADLRADRGTAIAAAIYDTRATRIAAGLGRPAGWRPVRPGRRIRPPRG